MTRATATRLALPVAVFLLIELSLAVPAPAQPVAHPPRKGQLSARGYLRLDWPDARAGDKQRALLLERAMLLRSPGVLKEFLAQADVQQLPWVAAHRQDALDVLGRKLTIDVVPDTSLLEAAIIQEDPDQSAQLINALMAFAVRKARQQELALLNEERRVLNAALEAARHELYRVQEKVESLRKSSNLTGTEWLSQQAAEWTRLLVQLQSNSAAQQAQLRVAKEELANLLKRLQELFLAMAQYNDAVRQRDRLEARVESMRERLDGLMIQMDLNRGGLEVFIPAEAVR